MIKNIDLNREGVNIMTKRNAKATEAPAAEETTEEVTFSAKDLAKELGIDAKSFRRWLRAHTADRANKGGRWVFSEASRTQFLELYRSKDNAGTEPTPKG